MQETFRPAEVLHQRDSPGTHRCQGTQPGIPAQGRPSGQLAAESEQRGTGGNAAQEQVRGHVITPGCRFYNRTAVVRR